MKKPAKKSVGRHGTLPLYKNRDIPAGRRVKDLLSRMTLEEKAAQMMCVWQKKSETLVDAEGNFDFGKARAAFKHGHGLGQVGRPSDAGQGQGTRGEMAELTNAIQKFFIENSRLGIPVIFHEECLHGHAANRTPPAFPQPIGLGATFNPELVEPLYTMTAEETRARGAHQALTPVVDVARDPRWGRVEETFGEDPYLVTQLGIAAVRGFQGDASFEDKKRVIATLKHFAAHGQPESGMNCAPVNVSDARVARNLFASVQGGDPEGRRHQRDGVATTKLTACRRTPANGCCATCCARNGASKALSFRIITRFGNWAIVPTRTAISSRKDKTEACALAVRAGVNIEFPEPDCYLHLVELVRKGALEGIAIGRTGRADAVLEIQDGLVRRSVRGSRTKPSALSAAKNNRQLALQAARETITLLKEREQSGAARSRQNQDHRGHRPQCRPRIARRLQRRAQNFTRRCWKASAPRSGDRVKVPYCEGCKITVGGSWNQDVVTPSDPAEDRKQIHEAVEVAQTGGRHRAGHRRQRTDFARSLVAQTHGRPHPALDLVGRQDELVNAMLATGKPVIVFLFNGRPLSIQYLAAKTCR